MCNKKCFRMHILVIAGVIITIVLVFITGITLTNSINISNIIKLREKVASDSAAQSGANAAQTRAALVEQQYSTLQQHHMSRSDLNYIAANHPKSFQRFMGSNVVDSSSYKNQQTSQNMLQPAPQNKIVIEIGIRNFSKNSAAARPLTGSASDNETALSSSTTSESDSLSIVDKIVAPLSDAIIDGNIDSISVPAADTTELRKLNASLSRIMKSKRSETEVMETSNSNLSVSATTEYFLLKTTDNLGRLSIEDHNPGLIDFEKREVVKKVCFPRSENFFLYIGSL